MLKASALYLVIVIALVIGLICSSLVAVAYFYRAEYHKKFRQDRLNHNLLSGISLVLTAPDAAYKEPQKIALFGGHFLRFPSRPLVNVFVLRSRSIQ